MMQRGASVVDERFLTSGDEAGTAPGDRRFRPDVEGLRAVAVLLVVLFHAGIPGLNGGFVGVDVFFVISGFVITGVLLRERASDHRTSILGFYGRRCRRIIPAATLVIVVTVVAGYAVLGVLAGDRTAVDGKWAAVFLANFHFASIGTNYLTATQPPSPLQNFWSLAVEEQFYLVYPTLFLLAAWVPVRLAFRSRLVIGLTVVIGASFTLSVIQTSTNATVAYFSPFTRAWELALGALVAVATPRLVRLSHRSAAPLTWIGLGCVVVAAATFNVGTPYPGWYVALPVIGTALVIAGGTAAPLGGAEALLRTAPFRQIGRLSYSLYLWHWPILILAAEAAGKSTLPLPQAMGWLVVALLAAVVTYHFVENPIRHLKFALRYRWASVGLGIGLIALTLSVVTVQLRGHAGGEFAAAAPENIVSTASSGQVEQLVASALRIRSIPSDFVSASWGGPPVFTGCLKNPVQTNVPGCVYGDPLGNHTMVVYGDSHAAMWFRTLNDIAMRAHWRLIILSAGFCPADMLQFVNPPGVGTPGGEWQACDQWHRYAIHRINHIDPNLVLVTEEAALGPHDADTRTQWQRGLEEVFKAITAPNVRFAVLGNIPLSPKGGPDCLAQNSNDIRVCSGSSPDFYTPWRNAEKAAAAALSVNYINTIPWFCSGGVCPAVIGRYDVYFDDWHLSNSYARYLEGALAQALQLPLGTDTADHTPLTTAVIIPASGKVLTGTNVVLDAIASDNIAISKVQFVLTGGMYNRSVIGAARSTLGGFILVWNSESVPNGTYSLRSLATTEARSTKYSRGITVTIRN
jgi:peptidoglycan/LPS O-acetylase OafA/YrhL